MKLPNAGASAMSREIWRIVKLLSSAAISGPAHAAVPVVIEQTARRIRSRR